TEVCEDLRHMDRQKALDGFELHKNRSLHDDVGAIRVGELDAAVTHRDRHLVLTRESIHDQLAKEACAIGIFQEAGTEGTMYLDRACENPSRQLGQWIFLSRFLHPSHSPLRISTCRQAKPMTRSEFSVPLLFSVSSAFTGFNPRSQ